MSYLTAHRKSAVSKYGSVGRKLSNLPAPYRPNLRPPAVNDNIPRPANTNIPKNLRGMTVLSPKGLRLLTRYPGLGDAIGLTVTALNDKRLAQSMGPLNMAGWTFQKNCTVFNATHWSGTIGNSPWPGSPTCFVGSADSGAKPIGSVVPANIGRLRTQRVTSYTMAGQPRYTAVDFYWRPTGSTQVLRRFNPTVIYRAPVLDPANLPIYWPVPLPLPLPFGLAPYVQNDPLTGTNRNNGDAKPVIVIKEPPGPNTKEVKLRAITGAVAVLQKFVHATTEGLDHLDSFHDALPSKYKAKAYFAEGLGWRKARPQDKAFAVFQNFEHLDWNDVIKNVIQNELEDRILGRANAGANKALNKTPVGRITRGFAF